MSNNFMGILRGGGAQAVLEIQVERGGGQKTVPSVVGVWIFSGITHFEKNHEFHKSGFSCSFSCTIHLFSNVNKYKKEDIL